MLLLVDKAALPRSASFSCEFVRVDFSVDGNFAAEQFFQTVSILAAQSVGIAVCGVGIPCGKAPKNFFFHDFSSRVRRLPELDLPLHALCAVPAQLLDYRATFGQV